jgi:hypothetical protein
MKKELSKKFVAPKKLPYETETTLAWRRRLDHRLDNIERRLLKILNTIDPMTAPGFDLS